MIVPKGNNRSWSKAMWKYLQRWERCSNRVMGEKMAKCFNDSIVYGMGEYEVTEADVKAIADLMGGKKPCQN
jgi:hypothetical protein